MNPSHSRICESNFLGVLDRDLKSLLATRQDARDEEDIIRRMEVSVEVTTPKKEPQPSLVTFLEPCISSKAHPSASPVQRAV
ncbi:hypothetical protein K469DRAFT_707568 [Zopfia rhizophila CBS 207.26]|uniref:Uncharacterized protein n=1 Tax=Zopfia rhizophila CBS 207.26 TaxID=1314779 RepID=A0A6A6E1Q2_9PEZI|nr:hypothetical protein K469DRAFT_707568 [Zopfia rhizophila CBS 207.26]